MKKIMLYLLLSVVFVTTLSALDVSKLPSPPLNINRLTDAERPFSGKYYKFNEEGIYLCKLCDAPLYKSKDKFDAHCGWPSFDDAIPGAIKRVKDADGYRTEVLCANCGAHLGHVFEDLEKQKGVKSVVSGYMGGKKKNPSYRDVSRGDSGYLETVEVSYDPQIISYEALAKLFFEIHDPTQEDGQGPDIGSQYKSAKTIMSEKEKNRIAMPM